jgi:DNA-binding NarL/FixJ family response regulator
MNIYVLLSVDSDIVEKGLSSIIREAILGSCIHYYKKSDIIEKIQFDFFDILIFDLKNNNEKDIDLIKKILELKLKTKVYVFSHSSLDIKMLKLIKDNSIEIISVSQTQKEIVKKIVFNLQYFKSKNSFKIKKFSKIKTLEMLLSDRELEIGLMLINGETISSISEKKSIATSTVSTYRKRVFEKTKVNNIIELAKLFKKSNYKTLLQ